MLELNIGSIIDDLRIHYDLSIEELALKADLSYKTIIDLINNRSQPSAKTLISLSCFFDEDFLGVGLECYNTKFNYIKKMDELVFLDEMDLLETLYEKYVNFDNNITINELDFYKKYESFFGSIIQRRKYGNIREAIYTCEKILKSHKIMSRGQLINGKLLKIDIRLILSYCMILIKLGELRKAEQILYNLCKYRIHDPLVHAKVYDILSMLYYKKGDFINLNKYSEIGICLCKKYRLTSIISSLYFWKAIAQIELESNEVRTTLNYFLVLSEHYDHIDRRTKLIMDINQTYNMEIESEVLF